VLAGAAAAHDAPSELAERSLALVFEAAIDAFASAISAEVEQAPAPGVGATRQRRIDALVRALASPSDARDRLST
jgi:hypothetical protein